MEQDNTYIAYEERTPRDLCRDINLKAEKFLKGYKKWILIIPVICVVLVALSLYFMPTVNWWVGLGVFGLVEVSFIVIYIYTRKLIHEMNLTANPKQFLDIVQRLKNCLKLRNFILISAAAWVYIVQMFDLWDAKIWWWSVVSIIPALFLGWIGISINPVSKSDAAFCDDVDELEFRLSE